MADRVGAGGSYLVGIDVGGTFTDLILYDLIGQRIEAVKVPSDRLAPDRAVLAALDKAAVAADQVALIVHGTTVATNALLERRGAKVALVTTAGFRDVLELGRTTRLVPNTLYDPYFIRPSPLVERRHRRSVDERVLADGAVERALDEAALTGLAAELKDEGVEAVVVAFLNAYRNPANELRAREILCHYFEHVTLSTEVLNEVREFERFSAAAINGYVMPTMARYVRRLTDAVKQRNPDTAFYTVASHGGLLSTKGVTEQPVRTILSGPAAGIAATVHIARAIERPNLITYDMGGTSTDVALVHDHRFPLKRETILDGLIIKLPQLDIHTVGAGGGSIARLDDGGGLLLGPESAGSDPGPAAYGLGGTRPTVTDANVVLGRLGADQELGKSLRLDGEKAFEALDGLARQAGLDAAAMADAVLRLAVAKMAAAVREISIMQGFDPRAFSLLCYGGAGPLHAALVADEVGMKEVVVPPNPGAFSAFGTLCSALRKDRTTTLLRRLDEAAMGRVAAAEKAMRAHLIEEFAAEGSDVSEVDCALQLDLRYQGQAHELTVTLAGERTAAAVAESFEVAFERAYGRRDRDRRIELVNARVVATIAMPMPQWVAVGDAVPQAPASRAVFTDGGKQRLPVWQRDALARGVRIDGPAIVEEMSSTTFVPKGWRLTRGRFGEIYLNRLENQTEDQAGG